MGAKSEALAKPFEAKAREAMATLEQLSEADWKKVTAAEQWGAAPGLGQRVPLTPTPSTGS